jgi:glycerol-3-phosphate dehydrogenase (NAD(P)+)
MDVAVVGAGSWGTALSLVLARNGHKVTIYGRDDEPFESLRSSRENLYYLPGYVLPEEVEYRSLGAVEESLAVLAVPSAAVQEVSPLLRGAKTVCIASKGLDGRTGAVLSDVVRSVVPDVRLVALSGPNLAVELAQGVPTAAVSASEDAEAAEEVRAVFMCKNYRVYVSEDMRGVELAGSLKNVMAIAAGISDGIGFGDNTKGALLARGLNEMARLGVAMGARVGTFLGVAGVGDLFATAASKLSRNYRVGYGLGLGRSIEDVLNEIGQVAEGVSTAETAVGLAKGIGVPVPITEVVNAVVRKHIAPREAVTLLMERAPAKEGEFGE